MSSLTSASGLTSAAIPNGQVTWTTSAGKLTAAVKDANGNDPGPTNPVYIAIVSASSGLVSGKIIAAPLFLDITSGSTMGVINGVPFALWAVVLDDAGTLRLGVRNCSDAAGATAGVVYSLKDSGLSDALPEGGSGGADSVGVMYANFIVLAAPYRVVGSAYWDNGLTAAGTWTDPTSTKQHIIGAPTPGDIVNERSGPSATAVTGSTTFTLDDNVPANTDGALFFSMSMAPKSITNFFESEISVPLSCSVAGPVIGAINISGGAVIGTDWVDIRAANAVANLKMKSKTQCGTTSLVTFNWRIGPTSAGTVTIHGSGGARKFGGTLKSLQTLKEIVG